MSNFSKEFYHWLAVSDNEAQRLRIRIVRVCVRGFSAGKSDASKHALTFD